MEFKVVVKHSTKKDKDYKCLVLIQDKKEYFIAFLEWV